MKPIKTELPIDDFGILFVDDDKQILEIVQSYLNRLGYKILVADSGVEALDMIKRKGIDIVFSDLVMPGLDGIDLLKAIKDFDPDIEVVIVTGFGTIESAINAFKSGSYDYLQKPINFQRLKVLIDRIIEKKKLTKENLLIKQRLKERYKYDGLVGISPQMQAIYKVIDKISLASPTVLIQGESGTGKGLVAQIIHENSNRRNKPFISVNCGAIAEGLLESELFGHVKGAFTGAIRDNIGLFRAAEGGTIFLDEIGEVPPTLQVKLLRVLQEKKLRSVGDTRESEIDVRVLAATNRNLEEAIRNQQFREDLFYRLNVISIQMPPLRAMKEDIPILVMHFMSVYNPDAAKLPHVESDVMDLFLEFDWPGNVRQLENVIERAIALGDGKTITLDDLPPEMIEKHTAAAPSGPIYSLIENEKRLIKKALIKANGNRAEAAKLLEINPSTVYRKLEKYNLLDNPLTDMKP
jgi:DNA-binding NtrC family response regulator